MYTSGRRVSCTPRSQPLPAVASSRPGAPSAAMRIHCSAASATGPGPSAMARATGPAMTCASSATTRPAVNAIHEPCTPSATASARCPAPNRRAARPVVP
jgi:hypothetical protein